MAVNTSLLLENGTDNLGLEDGSGHILLEPGQSDPSPSGVGTRISNPSLFRRPPPRRGLGYRQKYNK